MTKLKIKQTVILAGGLGTRLRPLTNTIPKPMVLLNNKPFLEYLIDLLKENGVEEIIFLLGYLPEKIKKYFGDGSKFGVKTKYSIGDITIETGKRIVDAKQLLDDNFLLMYCDNYLPFDLKKLVEYHSMHNVLATVVIYTNKDNLSKSNMRVDDKGYVVLYDEKREEKNLSGVDIGFFIMNREVLHMMPNTNFSFQKMILPELIKRRQLAGFLTNHRYYSIGDLKRLPVTEHFLRPKKVIFLDRDGVINKKAPRADYVKKWEEFEFLPGAIEAMKLLSKNKYEMYIITNQADIARKIMSEKNLEEIHENLKMELAKHNVKIMGVYYCPHGWNDGCECRKPNPGLFFQAAREHNIDLTKSIFIGDDERDGEAGGAANIKTFLITPKIGFLEVVTGIINSNKNKILDNNFK